MRLRREKITKIKEEEKTNNEFLKKYFTNYQSPSDMYKNYTRQKVKEMRNEYI